MFNLIKMDMYRLIRSTSTFVMIILTIGIAIFTVYTTNLAMEIESYEEPVALSEQTEKNEEVGIHIESNLDWANSGNIDYTELLNIQLQSGLLLVYVSIFASLFVAAERKHGFIKNIAGQYPNRSIMVVSKLIAVAIQVLIMFIVFALSVLISGFLLWGDRIVLNSVIELLQIAGIQYLLHFAFASFITFLCLLTNSSALSMTIGILFSSGLGQLLYSLTDHIMKALSLESFHISEYMLETNISSVNIGLTSEFAIKVIIIGFAYVLISAMLSMITVQKRDIK